VRIKPLDCSVVLLPIVSGPVPKAALLSTIRVPPSRFTPVVKVLACVRIREPDPVLVMGPPAAVICTLMANPFGEFPETSITGAALANCNALIGAADVAMEGVIP
jgi:hypothetical protein